MTWRPHPPVLVQITLRRLAGRLHQIQRTGVGPWRHPVRWTVAGLSLTLLLGWALLMLPVASTGPIPGARVALFTVVSATCAVGMTLVDTGSTWSGFGQAVILLLVEIGGLAMMVTATLLGLVAATRLGLHSRLVSRSPSGSVDLATVRQVVRGSLLIALTAQFLTFLALLARLLLGYHYPWGRACSHALFHAVSAFNNAGLSLWPDNVAGFSGDPLILLTLLAAVIAGGLGYPVLIETLRVRPVRRWSVHTRLTLVVTFILLVVGPVALLVGEWHNPDTLGGLTPGTRVLSGIFDGIAPRTAAFHTIDYADADASTLLVLDLLMVVGAGSGGTAGGIKVTTVAVLVLAVVAEVRGNTDIDVFDRRLAAGTIRQALAVVGLALAVIGVVVLTLLESTGDALGEVLFDVSSAFGSVGLTTGVTAALPPAEQYLMIALMLVGRVGPIAVATTLALRPTRNSYRNPEARPILG
ncbi:MAG: potassium transporter TrkG [Kineosporiaceae bacterium]